MTPTERKNEIFSATDGGLTIFRHILPDLPSDPKKLFFSHLREESTASAHLHMGNDGVWVYKDFGMESGFNAVDFIAEYKKVAFKEALKIAADYANVKFETSSRKKVEIRTVYPDSALIAASLAKTDSLFHGFCKSLGIGKEHLEKWRVGTSESGRTDFHFVDNSGVTRNIKTMLYRSDGHRDKDVFPYSLQHPSDHERYSMCFYGEHLLSGNEASTICIVESEKTAVIASWFYNQYEWLATGGLAGAKKEDFIRTKLASGRQILVLLDADPNRKIPKAFTILKDLGAKVNTVDLYPDRKDKTDIADYIIEGLRPEIAEDKITVFWRPTDKGGLQIMPYRFGLFLSQNHFSKVYPDGSNDPSLVRIGGRFIEETSPERMRDYVRDYLENGPFGEDVLDLFTGSPRFFTESYLSAIKTKQVSFQEDTTDSAYLYYQNCAIRITPTGIESIPYSTLNGYVWKNHVLPRDYVPTTQGKGEYERFIDLVGNQDADKIHAFRSAIGYMLHGYKTLAKSKAIILNDETIGENPNGGSGKGIFCQALGHMKNLVKIDAKAFNPASQFSFQSVTPQTQIVLFNDAKQNFDFEALFNVVTDSFRIERKNKDEIIIPQEKSPKIIISTNYAIKGSGPSHNRRRFELELSSYFSDTHTAFDEFKHELFRDWDKKEWARFDRFMTECILQYLAEGLADDKSHNLKLKKFHSETSPEFVEWAMEDGNLPADSRMYRSEKHKEFLSVYADQTKFVTQRVFKRYIDAYARFADLEPFEGNTMGRWFELRPKKAVTTTTQEDQDCPF
jgi:hypothetical protein